MALFALQQWHQLNLSVDFWCISKLSVWGVFRDLDHGYSSRQGRAYYWQRQKCTIPQVALKSFVCLFGGGHMLLSNSPCDCTEVLSRSPFAFCYAHTLGCCHFNQTLKLNSNSLADWSRKHQRKEQLKEGQAERGERKDAQRSTRAHDCSMESLWIKRNKNMTVSNSWTAKSVALSNKRIQWGQVRLFISWIWTKLVNERLAPHCIP